MPRAAGSRDRRSDVLGILGAEEAVLARVGVEAAHGDPGGFEVSGEGFVGQPDHVEHAVVAHPIDRLTQRAVRADVGDRERAVRQHHRDARRPAQLRDQLGVPDELRIGELRGFLVHRHRDDPGHAPLERIDRRSLDVGARRGAGFRAELARTMLLRSQHPQIDDIEPTGLRVGRHVDRMDRECGAEQRLTGLQDLGVAVHDHGVAECTRRGGTQDDLGPDPRGVAHRDRHRHTRHERPIPNRSTTVDASPNPPGFATMCDPSVFAHQATPGASVPPTRIA